MPGTPSGAIIATSLVTAKGTAPSRGADLGAPAVIQEAGVAWADGVITFVGPADELPDGDPQVFPGCTVSPGFVDCHTHLPFVGWRADEFELRLAGRSYRELHGEGGIYRSAHLLARASDDEVMAFCQPLVAEMADHGTTAVELKTGYGLSVEGELRHARLARRLAQEAPQAATVTLLACHAVPETMEREDWVRMACMELIPAAASEGLCDAVDIYVEDIAFTLQDLRAVADAAAAVGLPVRCHADQLGSSGAAEEAVKLGARSADHLNNVSNEGVRALGEEGTVGVLLPSSTAFMRAVPPPVRTLVETGAAIALATDFNPGTSPVLSMPEAVATGCTLYGLTPLEALTASTLNPAWVLGMAKRSGTLEVGKRADLLVLEGEAFREVPYRPGHNPVLHAYAGGARIGGR
ncbi:MAG TPA: imidazolonepropionase [Actinomycetota bacterium]|nr:imidazolonepropionase [Actinomycetota bacterium]